MTKEQSQVRDFHEGVSAVVNPHPTYVDPATAHLRYALIYEELDELYAAQGFPSKVAKRDKDQYYFVNQPNLIQIADALGDLLYVVLGTAVSYGIDLEPIFQEVHRSNMSKLPDGKLNTAGKWLKGPAYSPANLEPLILAQCPPKSAPVAEATGS